MLRKKSSCSFKKKLRKDVVEDDGVGSSNQFLYRNNYWSGKNYLKQLLLNFWSVDEYLQCPELWFDKERDL